MKNIKYISLAVLFLFVGFEAIGQEVTTTVSSIKDSRVVNSQPTTNFGSSTELKIGHDPATTEVQRVFLQFDLTSIPSNAIITSAKLKIFSSQVTGTSNLDLFVERADTAWNEDSLNWNNQPSPIISDQVSVSNSISSVTGLQEFDVTSHAQYFLNYEHLNNGWTIRLQDESSSPNRGITYHSSEYNGGSNIPVLEVKYILPMNLSTSVQHCTSGNSDGLLHVDVVGGSSVLSSSIKIHKVVRDNNQLGAASLTNVTSASNVIFDGDLNTIDASNLAPGVYRLRVDDALYSANSEHKFRFYKYFLVGREGETTSGILLPSVNYQEGVRIAKDKPTASNPTGLEDINQSSYTNLYVTDLENNYEYASLIQYFMDFDDQLEFTKADLTIKAANKFYRGTNSSNATTFSIVTSPWNEHVVTWNTRPTVDNDLSINLPTTTIIGYDTLDLYDSLSLLPFVEYWQQNPGQNYGFQMALDDYNQTQYASRNYKGSASNSNFIEFEFKLKSPDETVITLGAIQDAHVKNSTPTNNYGNSNEFSISYDAATAEIERSLIEFDLSVIPDNAIVTDASLEVYATAVTGTSNLDLYLERSDSLWWEDTLNWSNQPLSINTDRVSIPNASVINSGFQSFDVADHVQHFIHYEHLNAGWVMKLQNETASSNYGVNYASSEHQNPAIRPKLRINYIMPVEIDFEVSHCTPGNTDGAVDVSLSRGTGEYHYYWWQTIDGVTGGHSTLQHGTITDQNVIDVSGLDPGLYLFKLRDKEWLNDNDDDKYEFNKMVLIGREGEVTTFTVNIGETYSSDTRITKQKDPNGDDWDNTNYENGIYLIPTFIPATSSGAKYDTKGLIQWNIDFDEELIFDDADLYLQTQYGHFRYGTSSNESWLSLITEPWDERLVTWNTQPSVSETIVPQVSIPETGATGYTYEDYTLDVLDFVNYWQENPTKNYGIEIALKDYDMSSSSRLGFSSSAVSGKKPQLILSYRVKSPVNTIFDEETQLGSIEVNVQTGQLPLKYLIDSKPLEELNDYWQVLKDSIPIDSITFFQGNTNNRDFVFESLESGRYFVGVYDNNGVKIQDNEVFVKPQLKTIDSTGIIVSGDTISVDTLLYPSAVAVHLSNIPQGDRSGFEIEIVQLTDDVIVGLNSVYEPKVIYDSDFQFAIEIQSNGRVSILNDGVALRTFIGALGDRFSLVKGENSVKYYKNGNEIFEDPLLPEDQLDFKTEVKLKGPFSKIILKPLYYKGPQIEKTISNPICGGELGSITINPSSFLGFDLSFFSLKNENGAVISSGLVPPISLPYTISNLPAGDYTLTASFSNGFISTFPTVNQITLGFPIQWVNISNLTEIPNTINSIELTTMTGSGSANSLNAVEAADDYWVQTELISDNQNVLSLNQFELKNNSTSFMKIIMFKIGLSKFTWFQSLNTNISLASQLPNSYQNWGNVVLYNFNNSPLKIVNQSGLTTVKHEGNTLVSIPTPTSPSSDLIRVYSNHQQKGIKVENTISSFCFPIASHHVRLRRIIDGGYYQTSQNILKVEYDEEYNDDELVFNIYDDTYDPINPATSNLIMTMPAISYGDNRLEFDFSCPGIDCLNSGIYILEVINDKDEKLYLRFKI